MRFGTSSGYVCQYPTVKMHGGKTCGAPSGGSTSCICSTNGRARVSAGRVARVTFPRAQYALWSNAPSASVFSLSNQLWNASNPTPELGGSRLLVPG